MRVHRPSILIGAIAAVLFIGVVPSRGDTATAGAPCGGQTNIAAAQSSLIEAVRDLGRAEDRSGAWRVKATAAANVAIVQVSTGCSAPAKAP